MNSLGTFADSFEHFCHFCAFLGTFRIFWRFWHFRHLWALFDTFWHFWVFLDRFGTSEHSLDTQHVWVYFALVPLNYTEEEKGLFLHFFKTIPTRWARTVSTWVVLRRSLPYFFAAACGDYQCCGLTAWRKTGYWLVHWFVLCQTYSHTGVSSTSLDENS